MRFNFQNFLLFSLLFFMQSYHIIQAEDDKNIKGNEAKTEATDQVKSPWPLSSWFQDSKKTEQSALPQEKKESVVTPQNKKAPVAAPQEKKETVAIKFMLEDPDGPSFFIGLPPFQVGVKWGHIRDNPIMTVMIITLVAAGGYVTKEYWFDPIMKWMRDKTENNGNGQNGNGKDNMADFTKSRARIYKPGDIKITLKDVAGLEAAKLDVYDIMQFLKNPKAYHDMGAKIPKGVLMQGPPGNGKTLLAKAIAGEVNCPFISVCASEFIEMFVGAGAARVRDLFAKAKELAPCILFIDEFDAIAKKRSSISVGGGGDEHAQTLGQLLTLMDGFDMQKHPIIILAATNRAEVLDPAVIRPGRFDRIVEVGKPYFKDRISILKVHLGNIKSAKDIDVPLIARATRGFSGAELANLVNEAAILAVNDKSPFVQMKHIDAAYDNITLGRELSSLDLLDEDLWETAIHEAGHAIAMVYSQFAHPVYKVTIAPRSGSLGRTHWLPLREKYSSTEAEMKDLIVVALSGGMAEQEFGFGKMVGLKGDLIKAREIAYAMVTEYGMADELRYMSYADIDYNLPNDVATKIHEEVQRIIDECYEKAKILVHEHRKQIEQLAQVLMQENTVLGDVVYKICGVPLPAIDFGMAK